MNNFGCANHESALIILARTLPSLWARGKSHVVILPAGKVNPEMSFGPTFAGPARADTRSARPGPYSNRAQNFQPGLQLQYLFLKIFKNFI
jgi:hypothetical protein